MYRQIFEQLKQEHIRHWQSIDTESFREEQKMLRERETAMGSLSRLAAMQDHRGSTAEIPTPEKVQHDQEASGRENPVASISAETSDSITELAAETKESVLGPALNGAKMEVEKDKDEKDKNEETEKKIEPAKSAESRRSEIEELSGPRPSYDKMERKLRGGFLQKVKTFIPELVVRQNGFEHGDLIKATPIGELPSGEPRYHFELHEKGKRIQLKQRMEFTNCIIEEVAGRLFIRKTADNGSIRIEGMPFSMFVSDDDAEEFKLKPDDLVDVACYKGKADTARVLWKHDVQPSLGCREEEEKVPERSPVKPLKPRKEKLQEKKSKSRKEPKQKTNVDGRHQSKLNRIMPATVMEEAPLKGKTVLIVADEHYKAGYKEAIEKRGGRLLLVDGHYSAERIYNAVKKSDVVIAVVTGTSHHASGYAKDYAKELGKPWSFSKVKSPNSCANLAASTLVLHHEINKGKLMMVF